VFNLYYLPISPSRSIKRVIEAESVSVAYTTVKVTIIPLPYEKSVLHSIENRYK
jgi:hypothetical protein